MISTTIFPGRYVQGKDARKRLSQELVRFGTKGFVICGPVIFKEVIRDFEPYIQDGIQVKIEPFGGECSDEEIERLVNMVRMAEYQFIVGLGGGKVIDTAKAVAAICKLPITGIPTNASTDAPCSSLSVIYTPDGTFKYCMMHTKNPDLVLVDTRIVASAPVRLLVAGMGDALATWFEAESCMKSFAANIAGDTGSMSAYALARLCYDTLLQYGELAKASCEAKAVTPALERIVEANTLLSGLGFESGGLAAAHAIHNGLTVLPETHHCLHGEKVAVGTLASLFLTDKSAEVIDEVYYFCESVGLPTTLAEIGLANATDQQLTKVAEASCAADESIHHEPFPVTPDMVLDALKAADAEGKRRKN